MMDSEILCLQWNEFQSNLRSSYKDLRTSVDFSDVTLVCEDGQSIAAHKLVLSSSSGFFKDLLVRLAHPQPLVFMRGLTYSTLAAMVNFIYLGEVYEYQNIQSNIQNNTKMIINTSNDSLLKMLNTNIALCAKY